MTISWSLKQARSGKCLTTGSVKARCHVIHVHLCGVMLPRWRLSRQQWDSTEQGLGRDVHSPSGQASFNTPLHKAPIKSIPSEQLEHRKMFFSSTSVLLNSQVYLKSIILDLKTTRPTNWLIPFLNYSTWFSQVKTSAGTSFFNLGIWNIPGVLKSKMHFSSNFGWWERENILALESQLHLGIN